MRGIEVMFYGGVRWRFPMGGVKFAHLGQRVDEEYVPDTADGGAIVNWDNVCMVRACEIPEEEEDDE